MSTIMVQVTDRSHTLAALQAACDLARDKQDRIALLKLVPVTHPGWLGTDDWGYMNLTQQDQDALNEYQTVVESRGIEVEAHCLQSISSVGAIEWAAECVDAQIVFAQLPHTIIPFWNGWQASQLRRHLEQRHCQLYLSQGTIPDRTSSQKVSVAHN